MPDIRVGKFDELADGEHKVYATNGREVGVFRIGDSLRAWENHCPHAGGPICQGKIFGQVGETIRTDKTSGGLHYTGRKHIVCPWHGFEFDIETGVHPGNPATRLRAIPVSVKDGEIYLTFNR